MGLLQHNREGYEYGSSLKLIANLKGKLMLIHGTSDVNATFSATMKMVDALMQAGKPYDLIVFPESTHGLTGRTREYWLDAHDATLWNIGSLNSETDSNHIDIIFAISERKRALSNELLTE